MFFVRRQPGNMAFEQATAVYGVDARDLQQVGEHGLEAVDLAHEDLQAARREGILDLVAGLPDLLTGQADRGQGGAQLVGGVGDRSRSEERRVGKECRSRWSPYH